MAAAESTKTSIRVRTILATAVGVIVLAGAACAQADPVDLKVVDRDTGQVLRIWRHHGRAFVAGQPGARYSLRVTNHTDGRVLVVLSVDGVNILTGETANYDQRGYVLSPNESYDVSGWRKSNTEVAAFTFAALPHSYAALTGRPADVGVIGMAVFREQAPEPLPEPEASERFRNGPDDSSRGYSGRALFAPRPAAPSSPAAPPAPVTTAEGYSARAADAARRDEKLGTAHGAREWSVVSTVNFERATPYPQFTRQIEYDTYARLVASGVIEPYANMERHPRPFPSVPGDAGYVPDPPEER